MPGLTMTDCSVADNVTQAKYEFERAMTTSGYAALSSWAVKWARSLLDVAAEYAHGECEDGGMDDLSRDLSDAHDEIEEAGAECARLRAAMLEAIDKLSEAAA